MPTRPAEYYRPANLADALDLLANPDAAPLAGGTRLLQGDIAVQIIVDLQALGLNQIERAEGVLRLGARVTLRQLIDEPQIRGSAAASLRYAAHMAGPNTFRNAATLGGIIASREPDSELLALLLALGTRLRMADQEEDMRLADYLSPKERPAGLITEIVIPWEDGRARIERVARTPADTPIVAVAVWRSGMDIQIAMSGISQRPMLLVPHQGELTDGLIDEMVAGAEASLSHPGDFRGSADYRRAMAGVLLRRACEAVR